MISYAFPKKKGNNVKKEIIESNIKEEVANGTMEILEQNLHSILVWDGQ